MARTHTIPTLKIFRTKTRPERLYSVQSEQFQQPKHGFSPARTVLCIYDVAPTEDNARVFAAAPDLLAALRESTRMLEAAYRDLGRWTDDNPRIVKHRAAIAKARGDA